MSDNLKKELKSWVLTVIIAIIIYLFFSIFIFSSKVEGLSMYPTFENRDLLFAIRPYLCEEYERGDIVIFKSDSLNKMLIKRVIGTQGDTIKIENGKVFLNGKELAEPYINNEPLEELEITVKENTYFLMGDNRQHSIDSRYEIIGLVKDEQIKGKIFIRLFPNTKLIR